VLPGRRLLTRQTLQEVLQLLPAGQFARVHRSYIVALGKIDRITRHEIGVAGAAIPVSASYEDQLQFVRKKLSGR
jgi:DNA-binding LytR/AlgR family response regulator